MIYFLIVLTIIQCICLCFCIKEFKRMQTRFNHMEGDLNDTVKALRGDIYQLRHELRERYKDWEYKCGKDDD